MTTRQASKYTGLSTNYLGRMAQKGRIKGAHKIETGPVPYWEFEQDGIDEYLRSRNRPGRPPKISPAA